MKTASKLFQIVGILFLSGSIALSIAYGLTVGNLIAFCVGISLFVLGKWFPKLSKPLKRIIVVLVALFLLFFCIVTIRVIIAGEQNTATYNEKCVLVLGCGIRGEKILPTLESRLDKCSDYLSHNPRVSIIVSGGKGRNEDIPEAEAMKRYLLEKGVPENQIFMENRSANTEENITYSKALLDSLFKKDEYTIACITSDYHVFRAQKIAQKENLKLHFISAEVKWYLRPSTYCREFLSICKFWLMD